MFAVVSIAGFQEMVKVGDTLEIPLTDAEAGKGITFDKVLLLGLGDGDVVIGAPFVAGASVEAKVLEHGRGDKILVVKHRRRKRYHKTQGHRQHYTEVEILKIHGGKK